MAKLYSEDQQFISYLELIPGEVREETDAEKWQSFSLRLKNGSRSVRFGDMPGEKLEQRAHAGDSEQAHTTVRDSERAHPTAVDGERIPLADGSFLERHPQDTGAKGYIFCRAPKDEVAQLVAILKRLAEHKSDSIRFETLEPSIEFEITRQVGEARGEAGYCGEAGYAGDKTSDSGSRTSAGAVSGSETEKTVRIEDDGLRVQLFVDAGNVETEISRWDALGIRFFTNQTNLELFIEALQKEFGC